MWSKVSCQRTQHIYTPGWRESMWSKVSCLRTQQDSRDQARTTELQIESVMRLFKKMYHANFALFIFRHIDQEG